MKLFLAIFIAFLPITLTAQRTDWMISDLEALSYYQADWNQGVMFWETRMITKIKGNEIDTVIAETMIRDKVTCTTYVLNDSNLPIEIISEKRHVWFEYVDDTLVSRVRIQTNKTEDISFNYVDGRMVLSEKFVNNKMESRSTIQYNEDGKVLFSSIEYPRKRKTTSMLYEYQDFKTVQQRFMKNGKVVRLWDYTCNPEGEEVTAKEEYNICRYKEENLDGSFISYAREEHGGEVFLYKHYFKDDTTLWKSESWVNETELRWVSERHGNEETFTVYKDAEKGKVQSESITIYDDEGRTRSTKRWYRGNPSVISEGRYEFDEEGKMLSESSYYKGKLTHQVVYSYQ